MREKGKGVWRRRSERSKDKGEEGKHGTEGEGRRGWDLEKFSVMVP